jgi:hypothetical protein
VTEILTAGTDALSGVEILPVICPVWEKPSFPSKSIRMIAKLAFKI